MSWNGHFLEKSIGNLETFRDKNPSNSWAFVSSEKFLEGITDSIPKHHIIFCVSGLSAGRSCQQRGMCVCPFFFQDTFLSSTRLLPMVAPDLIWNTFRTYSKTNIHRLHCLINITRQLLKVKQRFEKMASTWFLLVFWSISDTCALDNSAFLYLGDFKVKLKMRLWEKKPRKNLSGPKLVST